MKTTLTILGFWAVFGILTLSSCDKDEPTVLQVNNSVTVYIDGVRYYEGENDIFSSIERRIDSDGRERYSFALFASGIKDEDESFRLSMDVYELDAGTSLPVGISSASFSQAGNECSGLLYLQRDSFIFTVDRAGDRVTGSIRGTFSELFETCETDFRVEFAGVEID